MTLPFVFGLGSHHGDDQAGWLIVNRLRQLDYPLDLLRKAMHPADLLNEFSSDASLLICDACHGTGEVGTIHHWRWPTDALPNLRNGGTHDLSLAQVLMLAGQFADRRLCVEIWCVTGSSWLPASPPSPTVQDAAYMVAAQIWSLYCA